MTITEALAEIKTIQKRIEKKEQAIYTYLYRPENIKDPLSKSGGSEAFVRTERQAIADMRTRIVQLRSAINEANRTNDISINGTNRSMSDWIVWRREVAPGQQAFLQHITQTLNLGRREITQLKLRASGGREAHMEQSGEKLIDLTINLNEQELAEEIERLEDTLGQLDGQLSLKNATVKIHI